MVPISITGVCERDVDLMLLEEFTASQGFVEWFLREIGMPGSGKVTEAVRSITSSNGESDLELTVDVDGDPLKVLIENKVDAIFQPRQAERYRERGASYVLKAKCTSALTVIVVPTVYFAGDNEDYGFDRRVTYEALLGWFESLPEIGARSAYKRALLNGAINRGRTGWQLLPDAETTTFWENYWQLTRSLAPELNMPRPAEKPAGSSFVRFRPAGLVAGIGLFHKVRYGNVDLQFSAKGDRLFELERTYGHRLGPGMQIDQAAKSAVIRLRVPVIDMNAPFSDSESAVREGLRAACQLLTWYRDAAQ